MLRSHYRQPIDWTVKALEEAEKTLLRWYGLLRAQGVTAEGIAEAPLRQSFVEALLDDLNIPKAMAELHGIAAKAEPSKTHTGRAEAEKLARAANLLGLLQDDPAEWDVRAAKQSKVDVASVENLITLRLAARKAKNFAESDRLRDALAAMGVQLKDGKDPTTGAPVTTWEMMG
jgi:cysteinyl-tRNA synthetase